MYLIVHAQGRVMAVYGSEQTAEAQEKAFNIPMGTLSEWSGPSERKPKVGDRFVESTNLPLDMVYIDLDQIPDGQSRQEIVTVIVRRRGKRIVCCLEARLGPDPSRGLELILTAARRNSDVIKRITAAPWLEER